MKWLKKWFNDLMFGEWILEQEYIYTLPGKRICLYTVEQNERSGERRAWCIDPDSVAQPCSIELVEMIGERIRNEYLKSNAEAFEYAIKFIDTKVNK